MNQNNEHLESLLREMLPGSEIRQSDGAVYRKLDKSRSNVTGKCKHEWKKDSPNHWQCSKCGFGTTRAELVFTNNQ